MKPRHLILIFAALAVGLVGCSPEPQTVEVTRLVNQEVPVTVEVTRVVAQAVNIEVPVEVTRLIEVVATPTAVPPTSEGLPPTAVEATALPAEATAPPATNTVYTVQSGDNLSIIAAKTGVALSEIMAANNLTRGSLIAIGQQLTIPGWNGEIVANIIPVLAPESSPQPETPPQLAVPVGANLLPNPSFEGEWYFFNGVSEWQMAEGWSLAIDEGSNTFTPETDDLFLRPEVRVVSKANLPAKEHDLFVFNGQKTIKIFKGGAPTHFAVFTDLTLPAGTYRFTISFFPDTVSIYSGGQKVWATDPLAAEVRFIQNGGGSSWTAVTPGMKNTLTYDFTLEEPASVRLGADFLNRYVNNNNGWFLDDWSLQALSTP